MKQFINNVFVRLFFYEPFRNKKADTFLSRKPTLTTIMHVEGMKFDEWYQKNMDIY